MAKVTIQNVDNGFIVKFPYEDGDGYGVEVFNYEDSPDYEKEKCEALIKALYSVKEGLGEFWSKHNAFNVGIHLCDSYDCLEDKEDEID